ncbi:MAG: hypothetical protein Q4A15_10545 [Prevotellaceae bacterium]|nr:hypothetical protein [Prevotellaceae bacterium]
MPVKFDSENVWNNITVSLPDMPEKKIEFKNDNCVTINSTEDNLSKYNSIFSNYLNSANIELGSTSIGPAQIEVKNTELEELKARVEMLIELVATLNEENIQLKDRMTVLETLVANNENVKKDYSAIANWSKIFNTIAAGNTL